MWNAVNRYLHSHGINADFLPEQMKVWQEELRSLDQDYSPEYEELKDCRASVKQLDKIYRQVVKAMSPEQARDREEQKQNIER